MTQEPNIFPYIARLLQGAVETTGGSSRINHYWKIKRSCNGRKWYLSIFTCNENPYKINTYAFDMEAILISGNGSQVGHINRYSKTDQCKIINLPIIIYVIG